MSSGSWKPKLPTGDAQTEFSEWVSSAEAGSANSCQCGADKVYKGEENSKYWHSYWCPKYQPHAQREAELLKKYIK